VEVNGNLDRFDTGSCRFESGQVHHSRRQLKDPPKGGSFYFVSLWATWEEQNLQNFLSSRRSLMVFLFLRLR
jgi:hypothetical protein